ncbi:MAG: sugar ABC transporter permease [Verrucomicrobia bacterium]|nr:sugar ABC transporter permease [Verrucomicrobiota bacterium]
MDSSADPSGKTVLAAPAKAELDTRQAQHPLPSPRRFPVAWALVAPFLFFYGLFLIYPAIQVCYLSLTNSDIAGQGGFIGLGNYTELMHDREFWDSVVHTIYFVVLTVVPNTAVGFFLALLVVRLKRLRLPILSAFFLPFILPVSVVTTGALWILDANFGIFNYLTGNTTAWFQDPHAAMPGVALVTIWWTVGFNMLLFIAGLQNIPPDYYEAAAIDGANGFQQFIGITCPLIWPVASLVLVLQLIAQFKIFDQVYLLTGGGPYNSTTVVLLYMYRQAFQQNRGGYASAVAIMLVIIITLVSVVQFQLLRGRRAK